jgi:hypothetical protein
MNNDYGINWAGKETCNMNTETEIRYGVIPHHAIGGAWYDQSEPQYPEPDQPDLICPDCGERIIGDDSASWGDTLHCDDCDNDFDLESPDCMEPDSFTYEGDGYQCEQIGEVDIFVSKSPYYTHAKFCSPCAPGACYLLSPCDEEGPKAYCFGPDWFGNDRPCPYDVWEVATNRKIYSKSPIIRN